MKTLPGKKDEVSEATGDETFVFLKAEPEHMDDKLSIYSCNSQQESKFPKMLSCFFKQKMMVYCTLGISFAVLTSFLCRSITKNRTEGVRKKGTQAVNHTYLNNPPEKPNIFKRENKKI